MSRQHASDCAPYGGECDCYVSQIDTARIVADHWRRAALHSGDTLAAHALCMVLSALDGETDPKQLGIGDGS